MLLVSLLAVMRPAFADSVYTEDEITPELILREVDCPVDPSKGSCRQSILSVQINFETGSAVLTPTAAAALDRMATALHYERLAKVRVTIVGHADPRGTPEGNLVLSRNRAQAVRQYLSQRGGIAASRLRTDGMGATQLLDTADPTSARNRRVEFRFDH